MNSGVTKAFRAIRETRKDRGATTRENEVQNQKGEGHIPRVGGKGGN